MDETESMKDYESSNSKSSDFKPAPRRSKRAHNRVIAVSDESKSED